ncbi:O-acyltransferase WSD [Folsomia candida]|uniref:O-acyltransferase WSD n=1 Tax=Folsomia candida TaxID=158441 RepID=A0A226DIF9_FOLCA|nr:O-acyltransferase WSD [Folsomia candida]
MRTMSETLKVVLLSILAYTIFLPCTILFAIGILFWRSCIKALVYFRHCGQGWRIVDPSSVGMASTDVYDTHSWTIATTFEIHQETFDLQKLRTDFEKTILSAKICETDPSSKLAYPELTSCLEEKFGYYFWRPCPSFKIEDHFSYLDVPNLKSIDDPEDFNALSNHLLRDRRWKKGQPLWEWLVVEKLDGKSLVMFRIHHIIADGWSLFKLAARMFTTENSVPLASVIPLPNASRGRSCLISPNFIKAPYEMVKLSRTLNSSTTLIPEEGMQ